MEPIVWTGDLDDDCTARLGEWGAHAEAMDEDSWYCSVYRTGTRNSDIFHSSEHDIHPLTGNAARRLCELVMRAAVAGVFIDKPVPLNPKLD